MPRRILRFAKKSAEYSLIIVQKIWYPIENHIEKRSIPTRYALASVTILFGFANLINPLIPGVFFLAAGTRVFHRARKDHGFNLKRAKELSAILMKKGARRTVDTLYKVKDAELTQQIKKNITNRVGKVLDERKQQLYATFLKHNPPRTEKAEIR